MERTSGLLRRLAFLGFYGFETTASTEVYDASTGNSSPAGGMHVGREGHSTILLTDGRVLVLGACRPSLGRLGEAGGRYLVAALLQGPGGAKRPWGGSRMRPSVQCRPRSSNSTTMGRPLLEPRTCARLKPCITLSLQNM